MAFATSLLVGEGGHRFPGQIKLLKIVNVVQTAFIQYNLSNMNFEFRVMAKTFPAIALVISVACYLLHLTALGDLFLLVAFVSFALTLLARQS